MREEARMIEDGDADSYGDALSRTINDEDKLERLERNLQKAKDLNDVGDGKTEEAVQKAEQQKKKSKSAMGNEENGVVYAPSIDEVTADNDHLANLRGEGRYFGVTDPDANQPVCSNCHRRGHKRAHCKVVVCHACGKVDDHYETQCPNSMVCSNCGEKGHFRNNCPSKRNQTYCVECDSRNHSSERCPSIWRSYVLRPADKNAKVAYPSAKIFCYNCATKGHYGDDCRQMRVSKTPNINGSAFSGDNLPKVLVSQYRNMLNRESQSYTGDNSRKRKFDATASTNYNYAPPPYPRFNRDSNNNNNSNNNGNNNRNNYSSNLPRGPKRPSKVGYIPPRNNNQNQGRNNGYSNNYNNNKGNQNSQTSRTSYLNNSNNNNNNNRGSDYNRNSYNRRY